MNFDAKSSGGFTVFMEHKAYQPVCIRIALIGRVTDRRCPDGKSVQVANTFRIP